jgi:hypothetical protein
MAGGEARSPLYLCEDDQFLMILMGTAPSGRMTFGLLTSPNGLPWTALAEEP